MAPRRWLVKTEPTAFSIDDFEKAPDRTTFWDGIRSYAARNHLKAMRVRDEALVYHSNADPSAVVGVATVVREAYPDPSQFDPAAGEMRYDPRSNPEDPRWVMVDLRLKARLDRPISLDEVKRTPALKAMTLLRISQLSVQPVTAKEFATILDLAARPPAPPAKRASAKLAPAPAKKPAAKRATGARGKKL